MSTRSAVTILIADDDEEVRKLVREVFEERDYEVIEAADGREAMERLRRGRVDVAIIDLVLPDQEGIELIRILRDEHSELGIVAISGAFGGSFLNCAKHLGAHAVLKKPFCCEALVESVRDLLRTPAPR